MKNTSGTEQSVSLSYSAQSTEDVILIFHCFYSFLSYIFNSQFDLNSWDDINLTVLQKTALCSQITTRPQSLYHLLKGKVFQVLLAACTCPFPSFCCSGANPQHFSHGLWTASGRHSNLSSLLQPGVLWLTCPPMDSQVPSEQQGHSGRSIQVTMQAARN